MVNLKEIDEKLDFILEDNKLRGFDMFLVTLLIFFASIFLVILLSGSITPLFGAFLIIPLLAYFFPFLIFYAIDIFSFERNLALRIITFSIGAGNLAFYLSSGILLILFPQLLISKINMYTLLLLFPGFLLIFVEIFTKIKLSKFFKKNFKLHYKKYKIMEFKLKKTKRKKNKLKTMESKRHKELLSLFLSHNLPG